MADLPHALEKKSRSLANLQSLILGGKFGNVPEKLKPLYNLVVSNLREELQARHVSTEGQKKPELQAKLTEILQGTQRVPTILTQNPSRPLSSLNLQRYEVLDCEPLHDLKGHLYNLLPEFVALLPSPLNEECKRILDSTLVKDKTSGALFRAAVVKLMVHIQKSQCVDDVLMSPQ